MKYERITEGIFLDRSNRFVAHVNVKGQEETVHVKNTGRLEELFRPGTKVYLQEALDPDRKTRWDLIGVATKNRLINVDSQAPNKVVQEWVEKGEYFPKVSLVRPETTHGDSRFDLYVETEDSRRIFIEVKGVTLEKNGEVRFPDAPSERALKHVEALSQVVKEGYEAYLIFVIQMKNVWYFTPNQDTQPAFGEALKKAKKAGVHLLAFDCEVTKDSLTLAEEVPVVLYHPELMKMVDPLMAWYPDHHRELPWRKTKDPYRIWVSEIMLQQTRVETVIPYYQRFLEQFPTVKDLAEAPEDLLLKTWEGLGYYQRARNMQKAAQQIVTDYEGQFPETYEEIRSLKGIGSYTAGAIASFSFGVPCPAVDGNGVRVISRILASQEDVSNPSVREEIEEAVAEVIPEKDPATFNQGLIELGATICAPHGRPDCEDCPVKDICEANRLGIQEELPMKKKGKERRIEERTVLIFQDVGKVVIQKRPEKGLLAGLYELPNVEGHLNEDEVISFGKSIGLTPVRVKRLPEAKHIFSHVEWRMIGYLVWVDELADQRSEDLIYAGRQEIDEKYPIPSAFDAYLEWVRPS